MSKVIKYLSFVFILLGSNASAQVLINEINIDNAGNNSYIEIYNYSAVAVDLTGYVLDIDISVGGGFNFVLPAITLAPDSMVVVAETPAVGDINIGQPIPWNTANDLSVALKDPLGNTVDFVAHGTTVFSAPAGVTFTPAPLNSALVGTNTVTYQKGGVTNVGGAFVAVDWLAAPATRNLPNLNQPVFLVTVPTLSEWALFLLIALLSIVGIKQTSCKF